MGVQGVVTVQRQGSSVADKAERLHRIQHGIGGQQGERVTHIQLQARRGKLQAARINKVMAQLFAAYRIADLRGGQSLA